MLGGEGRAAAAAVLAVADALMARSEWVEEEGVGEAIAALLERAEGVAA